MRSNPVAWEKFEFDNETKYLDRITDLSDLIFTSFWRGRSDLFDTSNDIDLDCYTNLTTEVFDEVRYLIEHLPEESRLRELLPKYVEGAQRFVERFEREVSGETK